MRILWVKSDFLHPTDRGGQIRSLETLRRLHENHEVHFVAYADPKNAEGASRAYEYSSYSYPVHRPIPRRGSPAFASQLVSNFFSDLPLAVGRYRSPQMLRQVHVLLLNERFDAVVCDFLSVAPNIPDLRRSVLFQHNVETMIWRRHAEHAADPIRRRYFQSQANRMFETERDACNAAAHVIAVSPQDADQMRTLFGVDRISSISTGVDLDFFRRPEQTTHRHDLVFVGAMDWLPNIDGARHFIREVLPLIRRRRPDCSLVLAGRSPVPEVRGFASKDPLITVTGTVADIRPYFWDSGVSIVPLRVGGGTRLKIYEAMAAGTPVVSTHVGAEGLPVSSGADISLASDPAAFADSCLALLEDRERARKQSAAALALVSANFSWDRVAQSFEETLKQAVCAV